MKAASATLIILISAVILAPGSAPADVWRCPGGVYASSARADGSCEKISGGSVCGEGKNRYIAPGSSTAGDKNIECESDAEESSPFVNNKLVQIWKEENQSKKKPTPAPRSEPAAVKPVEEQKIQIPMDYLPKEHKSLLQKLLGSFF